MRRSETGAGLVEGLVSLTILSVGILGLAAMQSELIQSNTESRVRMQAGFQASSLIGMAASQPANAACFVINSKTSAPCSSDDARKQADAWQAQVAKALPGSDGLPPTVSYDSASGQFTVALRWRMIGDDTVHNYLVVTSIAP